MRFRGAGKLTVVALGCAGFLIVLAGAAGVVRADSLTDALNVRAVGQGEAVRASASGAAAIGINPAGLVLTRSYSLEGSYGYRGEDSTTIAGAAVCDSTTNRVGACLHYSYFGDEPEGGSRSLHDIGLTVAYPIGDKLMLGQTTRYIDYTEKGTQALPDDHSRDGSLTSDLGLVLRLAEEFSIGGVFYNLLGHDDDNFPRGVGTGVSLLVAGKLNLGADAVWHIDHPDGEKTGRYSAGAELFLTGEGGEQGYPLRVGYVYDRSTFDKYVTAGLGFVTPRLGLDLGMRKQVGGDVGNELLFEVGLRLFMPQ
jgi:hypothetical protein